MNCAWGLRNLRSCAAWPPGSAAGRSTPHDARPHAMRHCAHPPRLRCGTKSTRLVGERISACYTTRLTKTMGRRDGASWLCDVPLGRFHGFAIARGGTMWDSPPERHTSAHCCLWCIPTRCAGCLNTCGKSEWPAGVPMPSRAAPFANAGRASRAMQATPARRKCRRAGIILLNCRNSETCNKKEKTPLHDHLEYLLVQNPPSEQHKDRT